MCIKKNECSHIIVGVLFPFHSQFKYLLPFPSPSFFPFLPLPPSLFHLNPFLTDMLLSFSLGSSIFPRLRLVLSCVLYTISIKLWAGTRCPAFPSLPASLFPPFNSHCGSRLCEKAWLCSPPSLPGCRYSELCRTFGFFSSHRRCVLLSLSLALWMLVRISRERWSVQYVMYHYTNSTLHRWEAGLLSFKVSKTELLSYF